MTDVLHVAVDRGGTFTDFIAVTPDGAVHVRKVLSTVPGRLHSSIRAGLQALIDEFHLPVGTLRIGTTVATNALLTGQGRSTALVLTAGLEDLSWIGDQTRPDLFALKIDRSPGLHQCVIAATGRLDVDGAELEPLDLDAVSRDLSQARADGCTALAICLMHGWRHPQHEAQVKALAIELGFDPAAIATSSDVPIEGLVQRMNTVAADASLTPLLRESVADVAHVVPPSYTLCMHSAGGLVEADAIRGPNAVLSGPAGGVVAAAAIAEAHGLRRLVTVDMGGTSTDVCWWDGSLHRRPVTPVGPHTLAVPSLAVETIAAGGGSICSFDGVRLQVGPASAGSDPGPACYRLGGPATLTDCFVVTGQLPTEALPSVFGPTNDLPADDDASRAALQQVHDAMSQAGCALGDVEALAKACIDIAVDAMANAVRRVTTAQGRSLDDVALVAFGGAGGLVACALAESLQLHTVVLHPLAGVLSAWGIGRALPRQLRRASVRGVLDSGDDRQHVHTTLDALQDQIGHRADSTWKRLVDIAVPDWDRAIAIDASLLHDVDAARAEFGRRCRARFGWLPPEGPLDMIGVQVERIDRASEATAATRRRHRAPGSAVVGPAVLQEHGSTAWVPSAWRGEVCDDGVLMLTADSTMAKASRGVDAASVTLFANRMQSIAHEMGALLQFTARSVNIRERLDYSCAIFTPEGELLANGPHMPVHLGSMGASVRHVLAACSEALSGGASILLNDPSNGGTHLPDLTVVSPVHHEGRCIGIVASRGHHSDVGGITPGSMPPHATTLEEEGVVLHDLTLVRDGVLQSDHVRAALANGRWPCRAPDRVLDDLRAQLAANQRGAERLMSLAGELGDTQLPVLMAHLLDQGDQLVRRALVDVTAGRATMPQDDGTVIAVSITPTDGGGICIDFDGTSDQATSNRNAPRAVTHAAVLYVVRCMVNDEIPLNDGCLRSVDIRIPEGSLLSPGPDAAVAGGNVETSQQVVDVLHAALGRQAACQGTMNNLAFGDDVVQHYETICGGIGAGPSHDGAHCVQGHMTNSRLTDPEVLERRFPIVLWRLARHHGSGGHGLHRGGDGVERIFQCRDRVQVTLLSSRRVVPPPGMDGGGDGACGGQWLIRGDQRTPLDGNFAIDCMPGDRIVIETPGGGGWGRST